MASRPALAVPSAPALPRLLIGALTAGAAACAAPTSDSAHPLDQAPQIELHPVYRIDDVITGASAEPSDWAIAVLDARNRLFLLRPWLHDVLVLDSLGREAGAMGGQGEGPGEFGSPSAIGLLGDSIVVSDPGLGRVHYFGTDGTHIESRRWIGALPPSRLANGWLITGTTPVGFGHSVGLMRPMVMAMASPPGVGAARDSVGEPLMAIDREGAVVDTVAWASEVGAGVGQMHNGVVHYLPVPFQRFGHTYVMPGGEGVVTVRVDNRATAQGEGGADDGRLHVRVTRIGMAGDTVFTTILGAPAAPVTDHAIRKALERATVSPPDREGPSIASWLREIARSGLLPPWLPPVSRLVVGVDGTIWLRGPAAGDPQADDPQADDSAPAQHVNWTILDEHGTLVGAVALKSSETVLTSRGATVVVMDRDALGRAALARYRW